MKRFLILAIQLLPLIPVALHAQKSEAIIATRVSSAPVIDGVLDEEIWKSNSGISGFKTWNPDYGKEMPFNTIVWVAYDDENLYYAFRCFDNEPDKIKVSVDARDRIRQDDWVCVNLDSFNDQQTLYCLYVNANGIQMDSRFAAGKEDTGMDLVFYSAGKIDEQGYTIEIKLPLKSIRFSNREPVIMAATFERYISRLSMNGTFPPLAADQAMAFLTQTQPIQYNCVKHYTLFELLPDITYSYQGEQSSGSMKTTLNKPDAGVTLKFGITSQMILDATLNPDFSQVEADAGQVDVNLRYELFYAEKRPFFQEGNENFQTGATGSSNIDPVIELVHTRNIVNPVAGVKLSGKLGIKNSVSLLYAADRIPDSDKDTYGKYLHYPILRYKHSLKNDGYLGMLATSAIGENSYNFVYGEDGIIRVNKSTLLEFQALMSYTDDTTAETDSKSGNAFGLYLHSEKRNIDYALTAKNVSEYFISQAGYINRTGVTLFTGMITPRIYTDSELFRKFDFELYSGQLRDNIYDKWETYNSVTITSLLGGSLRLNLKYNGSTEIYSDRSFSTSGFQSILSGRIGTKIEGALGYRKRNAVYYQVPEQGFGNSFTGDIRYLPLEKLHLQMTVTYQDLFRKADESKLYDYLLLRGKVTYQVNKYLFFRIISEYNSYHESLTTDFLASFTYIPGTVFHIGYGSLFEKKEWNGSDYVYGTEFKEMKRGLFIKFSYLFRL
jgi:hypothetical protein